MGINIKEVARLVSKYSKAYTDKVASGKQNTISDLATIRSNASTGAGLATQVAQNKTDIASLSSGKANKTDVYTKTEIGNLLGGKVDKSSNILWIDSSGYLNVGGIQ